MADKFGEINVAPAILAEQRVGVGHGLDTSLECLNVCVKRTAALTGILGDDGNACQQISDALIECGDEQTLVFLEPLARGNVEGEALEAYKAPHGVELGPSYFLEPDFPTVGMPEAEGDGIRGRFGADGADECFEALTVVRMDPREKVARSKGLLRFKPQDLRGVGAALRRTRGDIPDERRDRPCRQRLLQCGLVLAPLGEQRGKNVCAERNSQDAGSSGEHAVGYRDTGIAEMTDSDRRRPDDCNGNDEGCRRRKDRPATCRYPQK
jgi:hypothetical protein